MKICDNSVVKHIPGNIYKGTSSSNAELYIAISSLGKPAMASLTTGRVDSSSIIFFTDVTEQYCLTKVK